jgi:hypothetical protein
VSELRTSLPGGHRQVVDGLRERFHIPAPKDPNANLSEANITIPTHTAALEKFEIAMAHRPRLVAIERASMAPTDMDFAQIFDCFTFEVIQKLEEAGFGTAGEGRRRVRGRWRHRGARVRAVTGLRLRRCSRCADRNHPPQHRCDACGSEDLARTATSRREQLDTSAVTQRGFHLGFAGVSGGAGR